MKLTASNTSDVGAARHPSEPSSTAIPPSFWSLLGQAWAGALGLILVELGLVLLVHRTSISSIWELERGVFGLLPAWVVLSVLPAAAAALMAWSWLLSPAPPSRVAQLSNACAMASFGAVVAWGVGGGRHLATVSARLGFALGFAGLLGALMLWWFRPIHRLFHAQLGQSGRSLVALGCVAGLVECANQLILVRLYPAFHLGLSLVALLLAGLAFATTKSHKLPLKKPVTIGICAVICLTLFSALRLVPASRAIRGFDNFRLLMLDGSPTLGWGVELASRVAPPPQLDPETAQLPLGARREKKTAHFSFQGRSVLLISIDALRADHLGCYGYARATTPALDQLASQGVRFNAAYAPTPHTSYSITSLMTGKYMRPLLLQNAGRDSELWATLMRTYGYKTAAFFPPAVFFIDGHRFREFEQQKLGFEYAKIEFAEGQQRLGQVKSYLDKQSKGTPLFLWTHLFGPHEPYVKAAEYDFGNQDLDRYDSEVRAADATVGRLVEMMRRHDPNSVIIVTADHGEEFGDHGGRYHGTSVYDEQVRVPLLIVTPGIAQGRVIEPPVQTIDLLPTVLDGLEIVIPPRMRGTSLLMHLEAQGPPLASPGQAFAETENYTLLAEGNERLICQRRSGACRLFDTKADPRQTQDIAATRPDRAAALKATTEQLAETHGLYEAEGLRADGKSWPKAIRLALSGDAQTASDLAQLLDDADLPVRRKAAELLLELASPGQAAALRLALTREEDNETRAWLALALTRLGQAAPLVVELLQSQDVGLRRRAALVLGEQGDDEGELTLIEWFLDKEQIDHDDALRVLRALATIRSKRAVPALLQRLEDVRLRAEIATTLAAIGDKDARPGLAMALSQERFQSARYPLADALLRLGGKDELIVPLRRFLGVPDPIPHGLDLATRAHILDDVGGPSSKDLARLVQLSDSGVQLSVVVPPRGSKDPQEGGLGARVFVRVRSRSPEPAQVFVQLGQPSFGKRSGFRKQPQIDRDRALVLDWPATPVNQDGWTEARELFAPLPAEFSAQPGHALSLELYATSSLELSAIVVVPLRLELPPPPPKPWKSGHNPEQGEPQAESANSSGKQAP